MSVPGKETGIKLEKNYPSRISKLRILGSGFKFYLVVATENGLIEVIDLLGERVSWTSLNDEILDLSTKDNWILALSRNKIYLIGFSYDIKIQMFREILIPQNEVGRMVELGDVDGDGELELLLLTFQGNLYLIDKTPKLIEKGVLQFSVEDLDGDKVDEIIILTKFSICIMKGNEKIWRMPLENPEKFTVVDIDGDLKKEIIIFMRDKMYVLKDLRKVEEAVFRSKRIIDLVMNDITREILILFRYGNKVFLATINPPMGDLNLIWMMDDRPEAVIFHDNIISIAIKNKLIIIATVRIGVAEHIPSAMIESEHVEQWFSFVREGIEEGIMILTSKQYAQDLLQSLSEVKERVVVVSPYLFDTQVVREIITCLRTLRERGVDVKVITKPLSEQTDGEKLTEIINQLQEANIDVIYVPRIHFKMVILDDNIAYFGGINTVSYTHLTLPTTERV